MGWDGRDSDLKSVSMGGSITVTPRTTMGWAGLGVGMNWRAN